VANRNKRIKASSRRRFGRRAFLVLMQAALLQTGCFAASSIRGILQDPALPGALGQLATQYYIDSLL